MNILLIGNGGREHALAKKISESGRLDNLYSIPGNPGIKELSKETANIDINDNNAVIVYAKEKNIDLILCGPEAPLVNGLCDEAQKNKILFFGPSLKGAKLEGSKIYAKQFMQKYKIPTADFKYFDNHEEASAYIEKKMVYPIVIKADGLAAGKGVKLAQNKKEALITVKQFMIDKIFGSAGCNIVIEDFLSGEEMSFFYITDGKTFLPLLPAKDYKRAQDDDKGDNTGGMGSYAPHLAINDKLKQKIYDQIVMPVKEGFIRENIDYRGLLYVGLMLTDEGPKVIEFNCRFGDPETQVILPLIENDLLDIIIAAAKGKLESHTIKWKNDYAACIVIASGGYPGPYKTGLPVKFDLNPFEFIHAGTKYVSKKIVTAGGRVINCVALGPSKKSAVENAYRLAEKVSFDKCFYRKDIGK